ncbi:MAG: LamB/YcsF family protein [Vampirovibrionales bacterium]|nr:LamB/YcsF family protein [Vampirovibrionales bacterium]
MPLSFADRTRKNILSKRLRRFFDLNTDLGQSQDIECFADPDTSLLRLVSSVNIPCCVHDGDPVAVMHAIELAKRFNCSVSAHIGYPDPASQGYQSFADRVEREPQWLSAWILLQVGAMQAMLKTYGLPLESVRPHGALYWDLVTQPHVGQVVAQTLAKIDRWLFLVGPACNALEQLAESANIRVAPEVVLGKRYFGNGPFMGLPMLISNDAGTGNSADPDLTPTAALEQAKLLIRQNMISTHDGHSVPVKALTLHITPRAKSAIGIAERVVAMLGQPVPLSATAVGTSGWLEVTEPPVETRPWLEGGAEDYL